MLLHSHDPATGELVGTVAITPVDAIPDAVARAREAAKGWRDLGLEARAACLARAKEVILQRADDIGRQLTREMGKPLREAVGEVRSCGEGLHEELDEMVAALSPEVLHDGSTHTELRRDPYGVCAAITPWNYPFSMPHWMVLPALVAGNTVLLKPSERTPLTGQAYADCLQAVLPPGVLQVVHGDGAQGRALVDADVDLIAFTGSRAAGSHILQAAAGTLKRVLLELGGKDPLVVLGDADVEAAARHAARNAYRNCGQVCVSTERVLVDASVADPFEKAFARHAATLTVGHGLDEATVVGPMIDRRQRDAVVAQVKDALHAGARLLFGGDDLDADGNFLRPLALVDVPRDAAVRLEETFGPVATVETFTTDDEAVDLANEGVYGLGAIVFSGDTERARAVARRLDAGMVGINRGVGGAAGSPWVGAKQSGYGFHSGPHGHRQFAQVRIVSTREG
ncbi:MAG: aldehyde dehydrogenase [Alphaproteobacteria bacterium]|nr:aldehyde dehydrogenase [Alphaproteobacteria bacterium]